MRGFSSGPCTVSPAQIVVGTGSGSLLANAGQRTAAHVPDRTWAGPGRPLSCPACAAALNWYRACRGHTSALDDDSFMFGPVAVPTLLLWGKKDPYIGRMSVDLAAEYMTGPYRAVELDACHFLVQETPHAVADEICAHLRQNPL